MLSARIGIETGPVVVDPAGEIYREKLDFRWEPLGDSMAH
jgi:hypothetical protein